MISISWSWLKLLPGKGIYVFVHYEEKKCQKIEQSLVFGWICVAGELFIQKTKKGKVVA